MGEQDDDTRDSDPDESDSGSCKVAGWASGVQVSGSMRRGGLEWTDGGRVDIATGRGCEQACTVYVAGVMNFIGLARPTSLVSMGRFQTVYTYCTCPGRAA